MELVYLWVEEYKNIHNQGFNFSPKFECEFKAEYEKDENGKEKLKENCELKITKKENPIKNFFGDNLNITAIVGENGSGKSSINEVIGLFTWDEDINNNSFLVFFDEKRFLFKKRHTGEKVFFSVKNNTKFTYKKTYIPRKVFSIYFANDISSFLNRNQMLNLKEYDGFDAYHDNSTYLMSNNKLEINKDTKIKYETFNKRFYKLLKENVNVFDYINEKFVFNKFNHELHLYEFGTWIISDYKLLEKLSINLTGNTIFSSTIGDTSPESIFYKIIILFRLSFIKNDIFKELKIKNLSNRFSKKILTIDDYEYINDIIDEIEKDTIYDKKNVLDILSTFSYIGKETWVEKESYEIKECINITNPLLLRLIENFNRTNFFNSNDKEYNYLSLSTGEKEYLNLLTNYIYNLQIPRSNNEKFVFMFDEPDLGLHPNWQKRLIKDLIYYADIYKYHRLQLMVTSHSPFILSDLPKENVIFLEKDENGNCKNVSNKINIETFGANIHTLLSDGFFMKDGLMGEFAKGKINEIKEFYEKVQKSKNPQKTYSKKYNEKKTDFENIQKIIGEPFLKTIMGNYLDELEQIFDNATYKNRKKEELLKQFSAEELQKYLDERKNG
jgi:predicted ATP-binding protein involved in virulence